MQTRATFARRLGATALVSALTLHSASAQDDVSAATAGARAMIDEYVARVRAAGFAGGVAPTLHLKTTPQISYYNGNENTINLADRRELPPPVLALVQTWAGYAGWSAERLFGELFYWFFVSHELTHWLQFASKKAILEDRFASELQANRVAVAFFNDKPATRLRLENLIAAMTAIEKMLPNPVPPDADKHTYFQTNYRALGANPNAYGWYQLDMVLTEFAQRGPSFAERIAPIIGV